MLTGKPLIESIRDYFMECPLFRDGNVNPDYLRLEMTLSIDPLSEKTTYKRYVDGSCLKQFLFSITSQQAFTGADRKVIAESGFFQYFEEWIEENNRKDILPELEKYTPAEMEVVKSGYLFQEDTDLGRYQIQLRLIYR